MLSGYRTQHREIWDKYEWKTLKLSVLAYWKLEIRREAEHLKLKPSNVSRETPLKISRL